MKRIQKFAAVNVIVALMGAGTPAMAAQDGYGVYDRGRMQYPTVNRQTYRDWNDNRGGYSRDDERWNRERHDRDNHDRHVYDRRVYTPRDRVYRDECRNDYGYGAATVYEPAAVYSEPVYDDGYYHRTHNGRTAAIIGGSAAAGALIGAAAGHGQGAVIGAVIGGVAGAAVSAAANHHDRY